MEHVFDRPEVEALRGVEPTGTNGRSRHIFPIPVGLGLVLWWFLVGWQGMLFLVVTTISGKAFCLRPLSGSRTATIGIVVGSVAGRSLWLAVVLVLRWSWPR